MKSATRSNFYLINKPKTWTSQDLCSKFKYLYRFNKVGHAGTLDPNAEGLMLVATDKYTKLFNYTEETEKTYLVSALFGHSSDSIDTDTKVVKNKNIDLQKISSDMEDLIDSFLGTSMQKPPMYSAVKVEGKRLYSYARQGKEIEVPERKITISSFSLLGLNGAEAEFSITVSKGTYIRSLILDLAKKLNTTAVVTEILRTKIGKLSIEYPEYIDDINILDKDKLPTSLHWNKVLSMPVLKINNELCQDVQHGELLSNDIFKNNEITILENNDKIAALYAPFNNKYFKPEKMLL
jgi:tRNA pseudouridine55 synthase